MGQRPVDGQVPGAKKWTALTRITVTTTKVDGANVVCVGRPLRQPFLVYGAVSTPGDACCW